MKKVLVDLSMLKHINCGLGQIAYNYARFFGQNASKLDFEIHLLVPESYVGAFGNEVIYHKLSALYSVFPFLMPRFDVWHSMQQMSRIMPSSRLARNILTVHDINFMYEKSGLSIKRYILKFNKRINRADRIVFISNFTRNDVLSRFPIDKPNEVVYNGVDFGDPGKERRPDLPFADDSKFLFSIGQIKPKKNFHVLLDAMKLMPQYNLVISGEKSSDYARMIENRIQTEGIKNVFLTGPVHNDEKIWLYNHCQAFVFPSLFEGFGLPVIEAMSYGKPVVSSDKTSLEEICAGHAFVLENFEAEHIARQIKQAIDTYSRNPELIAANVEYAKSFSYERHMNEYLRIYRDVLNNQKANGYPCE